jgi:TPR repeat protein
MYATGQGTTRDDTVAIAWYQLAADQGDAQAQYNLGVMIANGQGKRFLEERAKKIEKKLEASREQAEMNRLLKATGKG